MNSVALEPDVEMLVEADEWAELEPKAMPLDASAELERQVEEYLAQGGVIQTFEPGETAIPTSQFLWSFPVGKAAAPDSVKRDESVQRRKAAQTLAQRRGTNAIRGTKYTDAELVVIIEGQLGVARNKREMREALGCSDNLLQRLLFCSFHDDPRADPYRAVSRHDREAMHVKHIRQLLAEGHTGMSNITKLAGLRTRQMVINLNRKYGLGIPTKEPGGHTACTNKLCHAKMSSKARYCPQCGTVTALGLGKELEA